MPMLSRGSAVMAVLGLFAVPSVVLAQVTAATTVADPAADGQPAAVEDATEPPWSLTASAGTSARDDGPDGSWQSVAITRSSDRSYVRASLMRYHGTLLQSDAALPSSYYIGTLGAGGNFDGWVVDGWASYGRQIYGRISSSLDDRESNGAKASDYYAVGSDLGRVMPLGYNWYLTPTVAGSFAYGKLLRPAPTGSDLSDVETAEPTWSASAGIRVDHAFGAQARHYLGLSLSRNWTSNGVSNLTVEADGNGSLSIGSTHSSDEWTEAGATASLALTQRLRLDLVATRGFGVMAGNYTNASISLRRSF